MNSKYHIPKLKVSKSVTDFPQEVSKIKYEVLNKYKPLSSKSDSDFEIPDSKGHFKWTSKNLRSKENKIDNFENEELFLKRLTKFMKSNSTSNMLNDSEVEDRNKLISPVEPPVLILSLDEDQITIEREVLDIVDETMERRSPTNLDPYSIAGPNQPKSVLVQTGSVRNKLRKSVQLEVIDDTVSIREDLKNLFSESLKRSSRHNSIVPQVSTNFLSFSFFCLIK